jgi:uncharacterized SAM-binding protein YcdF (DUF218 family)
VTLVFLPCQDSRVFHCSFERDHHRVVNRFGSDLQQVCQRRKEARTRCRGPPQRLLLFTLGKTMLLPLENRFAQCPRAQEHTGVVVLGGVIDGGVWAARGVLEVGSSADRLIAAALLARDYPTLRIMFSGGYGGLLPGGFAEAELAAQLLDSLIGMPRRTLVENRSRDTAENARFSKATIKPQPGEKWLLITSAAHMPRAIGAFRKADFDVEACPVDWTTNGNSDLLWPSVSASGGLGFTDQAVREWIGLTMYWLANRTSEFFPAP